MRRLAAAVLLGACVGVAAQNHSIGNATPDGVAGAKPAASAPARPGWRITGRIDEATVQGLVCDLARPFAATSPEVGGTWSFVPRHATAGSFTYKATSVGGVPGSGSGTYAVTRDAGGGARIKLDGTGSIHSPVGTFSATIYETLTLTPAAGC